MTLEQVNIWNERNITRVTALLDWPETYASAHAYQTALWALAAQPECPTTLARVEQAIAQIEAVSCE